MIADGRYSHSGTYNANVVQCAAVSATMDLLAEPGLYERQRALGRPARRRAHAPGRPRPVSPPASTGWARCSSCGSPTADPQLARRGALRRRGAVHPLVAGDAAARGAVPPPASSRTCSCRWCTPTRTSTRPSGPRRRRSRSSPQPRRGVSLAPRGPPTEEPGECVRDQGGRRYHDPPRRRWPSRPRLARSRARTRLLYAEVIDRVEQLIVERGLGAGDRLPSQDELAEAHRHQPDHGTARARGAPAGGRVRRHQGLGTFLRPKIISDPIHAGPLGSALTSSDQPTEVTTTCCRSNAAAHRPTWPPPC